jgi:hypothetical protein
MSSGLTPAAIRRWTCEATGPVSTTPITLGAAC